MELPILTSPKELAATATSLHTQTTTHMVYHRTLQLGRVGIFGGSKDYTGAPFYASIASLRMGADLAYVFTAQEAAPAIKAYSPELMVRRVV